MRERGSGEQAGTLLPVSEITRRVPPGNLSGLGGLAPLVHMQGPEKRELRKLGYKCGQKES